MRQQKRKGYVKLACPSMKKLERVCIPLLQDVTQPVARTMTVRDRVQENLLVVNHHEYLTQIIVRQVGPIAIGIPKIIISM